LSYQWFFGQTKINTAKGSSLTLPNVGYSSAGTYYVNVKNSGGSVDSQSATLTVTNTAPIAKDDVYTTSQNQVLTVPGPGVLANDSDADGDALSAVLVRSVSYGSLNLSTNGGFTYAPTANYSGSDSFIYQANDGSKLSNIATVSINITPVNQPPVANNQSVVMSENTATNLILRATDPDSPNLTYAIVTRPSNGALAGLNPSSGAVTYTPAANYNGSDSFTFSAFDGSLYGTGRVSLTITAPPSITAQPVSQAVQAGQSAIFQVRASGAAPLSYQWQFDNALLAGATSSILNLINCQPSNAGNYTVVVSNGAGSVTSVLATLTVNAPATIVTLSPSSVTAQSAVLNATVNPQGAATTCYFQYGLTANYGSYSSSNSLVATSNPVDVAIPVAGLASGTLYHYCAVAINSSGTTVGQDLTFTPRCSPPGALNLGGSSVTASSATLAATVNPQGNATTCYFQYGLTTSYDFYSSTNTLAAETNLIDLAVPITGLAPDTVYHCCLVAINSCGTTAGQDVSFTTGCFPPAALNAGGSNVTASSATLTATISPQGTATTCYFQYGLTTSYGFYSLTNTLVATTNALEVGIAIANLVPNTVYHCCLVAINACGTTAGQDVTFTTSCSPPAALNLWATNVTSGSAVLDATVNPQGASTACYFQYGLTAAYGSFSATNIFAAGTAAVDLIVPITGLMPGTLYHYCLVAANSCGSTTWQDVTFVTTRLLPVQVMATRSQAGNLVLSVTADSAGNLTVVSTTNLQLSLAAWTILGPMIEIAPGQYQFTNATPSTNRECYYCIRRRTSSFR
jgi:hypothetical protein